MKVTDLLQKAVADHASDILSSPVFRLPIVQTGGFFANMKKN